MPKCKIIIASIFYRGLLGEVRTGPFLRPSQFLKENLLTFVPVETLPNLSASVGSFLCLPLNDSLAMLKKREHGISASTIIPRVHGCPHCVKEVQKNRYKLNTCGVSLRPLPSGSFCLYAGKAEQKECICLRNEPKKSDNPSSALRGHEADRDWGNWGRDYFRATFPTQSLPIKWRMNMEFRSFFCQDCNIG